MAAGPTIAALILSVASWLWLFLINLPIGVAALLVVRKSLPGPAGPRQSVRLAGGVPQADYFGAEALSRTGNPADALFMPPGPAAGGALLVREWSDPAPMPPLDLLRIRVFSLSILTSTTSFVAQMLAYASHRRSRRILRLVEASSRPAS